jgi:DNA-binding response OmpR family regulator
MATTSEQSLTIILVEDHDSLRIVTANLLREYGYVVIDLACAEEVDDVAGSHVADIYILDLNLPAEDGISLASRIRACNAQVGIIMMTARDQPQDRVAGYESGADIYLMKPVAPTELLAALSTLVRRIKTIQPTSDLLLNVKQLQLKHAQNTIDLTQSEAMIFCVLARAKNRQLEYWQLIEIIDDIEGGELKKNNLEVRIHRLRQKLAQIGADKKAIKSIREFGYQLCVSLMVS